MYSGFQSVLRGPSALSRCTDQVVSGPHSTISPHLMRGVEIMRKELEPLPLDLLALYMPYYWKNIVVKRRILHSWEAEDWCGSFHNITISELFQRIKNNDSRSWLDRFFDDSCWMEEKLLHFDPVSDEFGSSGIGIAMGSYDPENLDELFARPIGRVKIHGIQNDGTIWSFRTVNPPPKSWQQRVELVALDMMLSRHRVVSSLIPTLSTLSTPLTELSVENFSCKTRSFSKAKSSDTLRSLEFRMPNLCFCGRE